MPEIFEAIAKSENVPFLEAAVSEGKDREKMVIKFAESIYNVSLELWDSLKRSQGNSDFLEEVGDQLREFQDTFDKLKGEGGGAKRVHTGRRGSRDLPRDDVAESKTEIDADASVKTSPRGHKEMVTRMGSLAQLDMTLIKSDLTRFSSASDDGVGCALLLQALRWRFSKAPSHHIRQSVLQSYIRNDVLGILNGSKGGEVFKKLLVNNYEIIAEYAARFINSIATHSRGRKYVMANGARCVACLCKVLLGMDTDSILRQQVLGSLQKCSLKREAQDSMIRHGMVEWTLKVLKGHGNGNGLADYSLEYVTALLMNLCLRTEGKKAASNASNDCLLVLTELLECGNAQVRHYINGTIYSLLGRLDLRERAVTMKMDETLRLISSRSQPVFRRQLTFILSLLISSTPESPSDDDEEEDGDEVDESGVTPDSVTEDERIAEGSVAEGESGEGLLCRKYLIRDTTQALREGRADEAKVVPHNDVALPVGGRSTLRQGGGDGVVLTRAVTPQLMARGGRGREMTEQMTEAEKEAVVELRKLQEDRARKENEKKVKGSKGKSRERWEDGQHEEHVFQERNKIVRSPGEDLSGEWDTSQDDNDNNFAY